MTFWCPGSDAPDIIAIECCFAIREISHEVTALVLGKITYWGNTRVNRAIRWGHCVAREVWIDGAVRCWILIRGPFCQPVMRVLTFDQAVAQTLAMGVQRPVPKSWDER